MEQIKTPGGTETLTTEEIIKNAKEDLETTLMNVMNDFFYLYGVAQSLHSANRPVYVGPIRTLFNDSGESVDK